MKVWQIFTLLLLVAGVSAGCGGDAVPPVDGVSSDVEASSAETATPVASTTSGDDASSPVEPVTSDQTPEARATRERYTSAELDTSYDGALPASTQLALGIVQLEGTENAVTPEQAKALLPLWELIQSGSLQSDAETNAVVKQIEASLAPEQLSAIADMRLTFEEMGTWMQERGLAFGGQQGGGGGRGAFGDLTEDERAAMRATRQASGAGGFGPGGGGFADMSEEERASIRATAEAGGMAFGRPGGGGRGQLSLIAEQVVELLAQLAVE